MIENLDERLLEVLGHPMSPQARDPIVGLRTDIAEDELDDDRRARFPWTFTSVPVPGYETPEKMRRSA